MGTCPVANVIADREPTGPMLLAASLFLLASAGCGWAPNMPFFIAARALSGMGAGGMTGLSFIIVADSFPLGKSFNANEKGCTNRLKCVE